MIKVYTSPSFYFTIYCWAFRFIFCCIFNIFCTTCHNRWVKYILEQKDCEYGGLKNMEDYYWLFLIIKVFCLFLSCFLKNYEKKTGKGNGKV